MGRVLYKPNEDDDFYVTFSTISDLPIFAGTAQEYLEEAVADQFRNRFTQTGYFSSNFARDLREADHRGTDSWSERGGWDNDFDVDWHGWGHIPRSKLKEATLFFFEDPDNNWCDPRIHALGEKYDYGDDKDDE